MLRTTVVEHQPGLPALIRPGELLTTSPSAVTRWALTVSPADPVHLVRLSPGVDVIDLAASLRDRGHLASPNHLLCGQPLFFGGPSGAPSPAAAVPYDPGTPCDVTVGVLDTGLAPHPWMTPWYRPETAETPDADNDGTLDGQAGHGTFVAGLILRRAPGVRLRTARVLDSHGLVDQAALLRTLRQLRHERIDVLNLSFGGYTFDDQPPMGLAEALEAFPVTVACAGNTGLSRPFWPAALPGVLAVGALDGDQRAAFSAHGPWVDAYAPGVRLTSSFLDFQDFHGYATWSGTSFAGALVAGAVADLCRDLPPRQAVQRVLDDGRSIPGLGVAVSADR